MIVIDTSAIMAILKAEPQAEACRRALQASKDVRISAATLTETMIVGSKLNLRQPILDLIATTKMTIEILTPERAQLAADAYTHWGKGFHPAALNFGDCFAYATAQELDCPLLYVGNDFSRTDIRNAVAD